MTPGESDYPGMEAPRTPEASSAATESRDQLLRAIGREAEHVMEQRTGEAAAALGELARAYVPLVSGLQSVSAGRIALTTRAMSPIWEMLEAGVDLSTIEWAEGRRATLKLTVDLAQQATSENEAATQTAGDGIHEIPVIVDRATPPAAVVKTRDRLLRAIGREAEHLATTWPGQASTPLTELAHAYDLVTRAGEAAHSISLVAHVPTNGFYVVPVDPDLVTK